MNYIILYIILMHQWIKRQDVLQEGELYLCSVCCLIWNCYESLHKPGLVTAPPTGQSAKVSVVNTSCISEVPLCAVLDQFCIWFCLFRFSSFSVCWIFSKIGSDTDKTTHIQLLDFILQKSLNSFAGEDTRQEVSHYLGKAFAYWHAVSLCINAT